MQLHLNPIHAVAQLRPSLKHLSYASVTSKKKNNVAGDAENTMKLEESSERKPVASTKKQVRLLRFQFPDFVAFSNAYFLSIFSVHILISVSI